MHSDLPAGAMSVDQSLLELRLITHEKTIPRTIDIGLADRRGARVHDPVCKRLQSRSLKVRIAPGLQVPLHHFLRIKPVHESQAHGQPVVLSTKLAPNRQLFIEPATITAAKRRFDSCDQAQ